MTHALFEPTQRAARERLAAVDPEAYARTRNALDGAVTRLSPYLTHGLLSLREVYEAVHARHPLDDRHKLVFELGWRAYYRHVWAHRGQGIHTSLHAGPLPESAYSAELPADVLEARTGVPAIDRAVRDLYTSGYVHNHARMWLASYLVHIRKVHWHAAARWMLAHLLDGDVASNHLSWQWVAGTGSVKPYVFNAGNVAKYAPAAWHSAGTAIDTSYEALDTLAHSPGALGTEPGAAALPGLPQPTCSAAPDDARWSPPDSKLVQGQHVWLLHPWAIGAQPSSAQAVCVLAVGLEECHTDMPWSALRWRFVSEGLSANTPHLWWSSALQLAEALRGARSVGWQPDPHVDAALQSVRALLQEHPGGPEIKPTAEAPLFEPVSPLCASFAQWWRTTRIVR